MQRAKKIALQYIPSSRDEYEHEHPPARLSQRIKSNRGGQNQAAGAERKRGGGRTGGGQTED